MTKYIIRGSFLLLLFYFSGCAQSAEESQAGWQGQTMGTTYQVKVAGVSITENEYRNIKHEIDSLLVSVNREMSTYDPNSEISLFNVSKSTSGYKISPSFYKVMETALQIYAESDGAFDVTVAPLVNLWGFGTSVPISQVPDSAQVAGILSRIGSDKIQLLQGYVIIKKIPDLQLDLSAIAKGYGVDAVANLLHAHGFENYLVEIGGEVVVRGQNASGDLWKIGIDRPRNASVPGQELEGVIALTDAAVATSGDYRNYFIQNGQQYSHTIDPATGRPVRHNLASVTIIANSCMLADGLATATMVMGPDKGMQWIEGIKNVEALLIVRTGDDSFNEMQTAGFNKYLSN